jgi:hypothetical protein
VRLILNKERGNLMILLRLIAVTLLICVFSLPGSASIIVSVGTEYGTAASIEARQAYAISFTLDEAINVSSINAYFENHSGNAADLEAYLTYSIAPWLMYMDPPLDPAYDPGSDPLNLTPNDIQRKRFTVGADAVDPTQFALFSDLRLGPGWYFLVVGGLSESAGWSTTTDPLVTETYGGHRGDTNGLQYWSYIDQPVTRYFPSWEFNVSDPTTDGHALFEVVATPEPSTWILITTAGGALIVIRRRAAATRKDS